MKLNPSRQSKEGSVLFITVITLFVLTIMAVSYLLMLQNDNRFVARDQSWNRALVIAEAGIEEAMAHINSGGEMQNPPPTFGGDGWSASGTNYIMSRSTNLCDGGYTVIVGGSPYMATITSTGMVTAPLSGTILRRIVQVTAPFTSGYQVGIAAITSVTMNGNNIATDSYDSSMTNLFTNGLYNVQNRMDHGDVASLTTNLFSIGNANIMGSVHMPADGVEKDVQTKNNSSIGSIAWVNAGSSGFEGAPNSPYFLNDFNMTFPDVQAPYTSGQAPSTTNTLNTGDYYLNGNFSGNLTVGQYQYVEVYVTGSFTLSTLNIQQGGTLVVYIGGSTATLGTLNTAGNANNFQIYGLPALTQINMSGNAEFIGRIYAPEATVKQNGGGSDTLDFQGAVVANAFDMNGHFNMHYDQNLARATNSGTYVVSSWTELPH